MLAAALCTAAFFLDFGEEAGGVAFEVFEEDAFRGDFTEGLPVRRTAHADADGQAGPVAGEPNDPDVEAEVLAAELGPDAALAGEFENFFLQLGTTYGMAAFVARGGQVVEVTGAGQLHRLQVHLGGGATDHHG